MNPDSEDFSDWIGKTEIQQDQMHTAPLLGMAAMLNKEALSLAPGATVPPLWHWLYFLSPGAQSTLAEDGHPRKGVFLPPISLPRRMWAGSRFEFTQPLKVGESVSRTSTIKSINMKEGRSGKLAFVCVGHEVSGESGPAFYEEHDIVYRGNAIPNAKPPAPKAAPEHANFRRSIMPDPVLLFRYSALTFNGHRIHYDRDYVTQVEGYPGLIVHGPLLATLLVDTLLDNISDGQLTAFSFKAINPVFDLNNFEVCGTKPDAEGNCSLWVQNHEGALCMSATATIA